MENNQKSPTKFETVWIAGNRTGVIYENFNFMNIPVYAESYAEMMHVDFLLHRNLKGIWAFWDKENDEYMQIFHEHLKNPNPETIKKHAFLVVFEMFEDEQNEKEKEKMTEVRETIEMFKETMSVLIELNPCPDCNGSGTIEIEERDIAGKDYAEIDLDECPTCNGRKTHIGIDVMEEKLEEYKQKNQ